jgi:hypothetical protein
MEFKMRGSAEDNGAMFAAHCAHATFHCPTRSLEETADRFFSDATRQVRAFLASLTLDAAKRSAFGIPSPASWLGSYPVDVFKVSRSSC